MSFRLKGTLALLLRLCHERRWERPILKLFVSKQTFLGDGLLMDLLREGGLFEVLQDVFAVGGV